MGTRSPVSDSNRSPIDGARRGQELVELGGDPLAGQVGDQFGSRADPGERLGFDLELERRGESDGADHPQRILLEPGRRIADGAQDAGARIEGSAVRIDQRGRLARAPAPGHRVDREVAARQVGFDRIAELDPMRTAEVGVVVVGPEGRDLEVLAVAPDGDRPELVLVDGVREERDDLLGQCFRGEVPVGRDAPEDDIAQRTADHVCRVTGPPDRPQQVVDGSRDRCLDRGRRTSQLRPRNRYERHASFRSSPRYGVNSE